MRAIITQKSALTMNLRQSFIFDIIDNDGAVLLASQTVDNLSKAGGVS